MSDMKYSSVIKLPHVGNAQFSAFQARHNAFGTLMSPVLGFDHFRLTRDVFGPHKHMHMSAVSYVFEDSVGYHNQDSMGTDLPITPGSLLWTWAGAGVTHHEVPTVKDGEVHGLQLFLDIPPANRALPPRSIFIPKEKMPVISADGADIKIAMGSFDKTVNPAVTPEPITLLDIKLNAEKSTGYLLPAEWNGTVYVLSGTITIGDSISVKQNEAVSFGNAGTDEQIPFTSAADSRFLLISGPPVSER